MGFSCVSADSFFHAVASPFHSFVIAVRMSHVCTFVNGVLDRLLGGPTPV